MKLLALLALLPVADGFTLRPGVQRRPVQVRPSSDLSMMVTSWYDRGIRLTNTPREPPAPKAEADTPPPAPAPPAAATEVTVDFDKAVPIIVVGLAAICAGVYFLNNSG